MSITQTTPDAQKNALRVLIVDDHTLLCESLMAILEPQEGFEISIAHNVDSACAIIAEKGAFDAILLDY